MKEEREITLDEMEKFNIPDDDTLWEWVYNAACETPLETILKDCKAIKETFDYAAKWFDEKSVFDIDPGKESNLLLVMLQFFYLGAWHGGKAYREMHLSYAGEDLGCYLRMPEGSPYQTNDEDVFKHFYEDGDSAYFKKYAEKIYKLLGLEAL